MVGLLKGYKQTLVSQSAINGASPATKADAVDEDILPQSRASHVLPVPAENKAPAGLDSSIATQGPREGPRATPLIRLQTSRVPHRQFQVLQQFEGVVLEVHRDAFEAQLSDMTDPGKAEEFADLPVSEISPPDRPLLVPGCIFYWILGYETRAGGQITRVSEIRLRRSPPWSRRAVEAARAKARRGAQLLQARWQ